VLDGWWLEGYVPESTGWAIGPREADPFAARGDEDDARDLYEALEESILPLFHERRVRWVELMRSTIALNASFFNTQRMLDEYVSEAYAGITDETTPAD